MSVKANELRIGNYIDRNGLMEVKTLNQKTIRIYDHYNKVSILHTFPAESFKGIPITEEWLLKFGFDIHSDLDYGIYKQADGSYSLVENDGPTIWYIGSCKYVHQLQNLYFALTGEELTIKNETI